MTKPIPSGLTSAPNTLPPYGCDAMAKPMRDLPLSARPTLDTACVLLTVSGMVGYAPGGNEAKVYLY